jgi:hypothetical protein
MLVSEAIRQDARLTLRCNSCLSTGIVASAAIQFEDREDAMSIYALSDQLAANRSSSLKMSFAEIEMLIGRSLPKSASSSTARRT